MSKIIDSIFGVGKYGRAKYGKRDLIDSNAIFGRAVFGRAKYGKFFEPLVSDPFNRIFSDCSWGKIGKTANSVYGIYQRQRTSKGQIVRKLKFYVTPNPRTEAQQANRNKFAEAIKNWQGLTTQQKEVYNKRAGYRPLSGYNLYIKEYMKSA